MGETPIIKLLARLSPPVMLALLIQSIYNIVDSFFVASYSKEGLTALSIIFPLQLLLTAVATGTGSGINILLSKLDGMGRVKEQKDVVRTGLVLGCVNFLIFAVVGNLVLKGYYEMSSTQAMVREYGIAYGRIILLWSLGLFLESHVSKMLQAKGNMILPMVAQVTGAVINIVLDYILIFGRASFPALGIKGAAIATVCGQWIAMLMTLVGVVKTFDQNGRVRLRRGKEIMKLGIPSIITQSLYTLYIVGLNLILKLFTEDAVTVLGIYYKLQTFFFIPLLGLGQVMLPIISYNYGAGKEERTRQTLKYSLEFSLVVMVLATIIFVKFPNRLIGIFSTSEHMIAIGSWALPVISLSFIPAAVVIMIANYYQGVGRGKYSIWIVILRQIVLLVPLAWIFHFWGLKIVWFTFSVTEIIAAIFCFVLWKKERRAE